MNLKLAEEPQLVPRSPERQRLADAITARAAAEQALETARRAVTRGGEVVHTAERRLEAAQEAVETSRAQRALEVADGMARAAANAVRVARAAALDAEDDTAVSRAALGELQKRLSDAEDAARAAANLVTARVDVVIRGEARRVLDEARAAAGKLKECRTLLEYFQRPESAGKVPHIGLQRPVFGESWEDALLAYGHLRAERRATSDREATRVRDEGFGETEADIRRHLDLVLGEIRASDQRWWSSPDLAPWVAARAALLKEPDAPLPPI
jgi:hypothetical protein